MFVENAILYVVVGIFYGAEFKFTGPNTWISTVHPFFDLVRVLRGTFMAKNAPKMPILFKKTYFGA